MAGYRVFMRDGSTRDVASATRMEVTGAWLKLFDADGNEVATYMDGRHNGAEPLDTVVTEAPQPPAHEPEE